MHPGEQHVRAEALKAITDHFNATVLPLESGNFTFDWRPSGLPGNDALAVIDAHDTEVARYAISITATKIGVPKVKGPEPEPEWTEGVWGQVKPGWQAMGTDGNVYPVVDIRPLNPGSSTLLSVTVTSGDQGFTFTPDLNQSVKYRPRLESV